MCQKLGKCDKANEGADVFVATTFTMYKHMDPFMGEQSIYVHVGQSVLCRIIVIIIRVI